MNHLCATRLNFGIVLNASASFSKIFEVLSYLCVLIWLNKPVFQNHAIVKILLKKKNVCCRKLYSFSTCRVWALERLVFSHLIILDLAHVVMTQICLKISASYTQTNYLSKFLGKLYKPPWKDFRRKYFEDPLKSRFCEDRLWW